MWNTASFNGPPTSRKIAPIDGRFGEDQHIVFTSQGVAQVPLIIVAGEPLLFEVEFYDDAYPLVALDNGYLTQKADEEGEVSATALATGDAKFMIRRYRHDTHSLMTLTHSAGITISGNKITLSETAANVRTALDAQEPPLQRAVYDLFLPFTTSPLKRLKGTVIYESSISA